MYYQINDTLKPISSKTNREDIYFAAILTQSEWNQKRKNLGFPSRPVSEYTNIHSCKAEVYANYILGSICAPNREHILSECYKLLYYINDKGIVFVDDTKEAQHIIHRMITKYQDQEMSPEFFLYGFLSEFLENDIELLEKYESGLFAKEENALKGNIENLMPRLLKIRRELTRLRYYYEQLEDMARELEGNAKRYFGNEELRNIHLFGDRVNRLHDMARQSIEYCQTLRDIYQAQFDHKQNKNMQLLTIITSIFFPLTVITGWYGMNFTHMPELQAKHGYPVIIFISLGVIVGEIIYLKKKRIK